MGTNQSTEKKIIKQKEFPETKFDHLFKKIENIPNDQNRPYFLVLIGPSQAGKSSFLKMICQNDEEKQKIEIGNDLESCTKNFSLYQVKNESLFGQKGALVLDSIGFGDTSGELDDITILSLLHCKLMNAAAISSMKIDAIMIFQNTKSTIKIKPLISDIILCLGEEIKQYTLICLTKINALNEDDQYTYDELKQGINKNQEEIGSNIPVIDLYTSYFHRRKGEYIPSKQQIQKQSQQISEFLVNSNGGLDISPMWNEILLQAQSIHQNMVKGDIDKKFGQLCEKYRKEQKNKGFFSKLQYFLHPFNSATFDKLRLQAIEEIIAFYEDDQIIAQKATEMVLCKEMKMKKSLQTDSQIEIQRNKIQ